MTDPEIGWQTDPTDLPALVTFFVENVTADYISHGEIMLGRALDADTWIPDLETCLYGEFASAIAQARDPKTAHELLAVATIDDAIAGLACIAFESTARIPYAELYDLVIGGAWRGTGLVDTLEDWLEAQVRARGIHRIFLQSGIRNGGAHRHFGKRGFARISQTMMKQLD